MGKQTYYLKKLSRCNTFILRLTNAKYLNQTVLDIVMETKRTYETKLRNEQRVNESYQYWENKIKNENI